jgi:hypothetical protein
MTHPMSEPWLDWQDSDSAPKDGTIILVCEGELDRPSLTWWHHAEGWMGGNGWSGRMVYKFGKWARIPLPQRS